MLVISTSPPAFAFDECKLPTSSSTETVKVKWVYDGDTLQVTDLNGKNKRKIRIIGIDTPEVAHHQQKAQLYGAKAREALRVLLKKHNYQLILEFDKEKRDRYARELAYTYLTNGQSISEWLLKEGYAKTLIIPPNLKHADCFEKAERFAQKQKIKLWKLKNNRVKTTSDLKKRSKGFIRLKTKVTKIKQQKKMLILELESKFKKTIQLRIKKKHLAYFKTINPKKLIDKEIIVSGILKNKKGRRWIKINHPSQFEVLSVAKAEQKKILPTIKWSLDQ